MTQSVLLVAITALLTWFVMRWTRSTPDRPERLSAQQSEAERAKDVGTQLDGARDRASVAEVERNKLALAKAVKAALWVTESRLTPPSPGGTLPSGRREASCVSACRSGECLRAN